MLAGDEQVLRAILACNATTSRPWFWSSLRLEDPASTKEILGQARRQPFLSPGGPHYKTT